MSPPRRGHNHKHQDDGNTHQDIVFSCITLEGGEGGEGDEGEDGGDRGGDEGEGEGEVEGEGEGEGEDGGDEGAEGEGGDILHAVPKRKVRERHQCNYDDTEDSDEVNPPTSLDDRLFLDDIDGFSFPVVYHFL